MVASGGHGHPFPLWRWGRGLPVLATGRKWDPGPKAPFYTMTVIPCASKLARSSPYLLSTNLQTSAPLLLDLARITREKGNKDKDEEQKEGEKKGIQAFLLIPFGMSSQTDLGP